jgi:hypothetical protein
MFTTRSFAVPFRGKSKAGYFESPVAEVAWFLRAASASTAPQTYTLYRRQLLVAGYPAVGDFTPDNGNSLVFPGWAEFYESYDLSVRREGARLVPNTLSDLTRRESRFLHNRNGLTDGTGFPYLFDVTGPGVWFDPDTSTRVGEDVALTNVLAFDVRVFDPSGAVVVAGDDALVPGDPGFPPNPATNAFGCYVDLGHGVSISAMRSLFAGQGQGNYRNQAIGLHNKQIWDTWSDHYETNGYDENDSGTGPIDEGANGIDDSIPKDGIVDDLMERETSPPYPAPLRGIEIRIRVYEPSSRQVRQVTVRHTFVPH